MPATYHNLHFSPTPKLSKVEQHSALQTPARWSKNWQKAAILKLQLLSLPQEQLETQKGLC